MVAKISNGSSFGGCINYNLVNHEKARVIGAVGINTSSPEAIVACFKVQAGMRPSLGTCVGHFSLDFHEDDTPRCTDEFMNEIAAEYMQRMKFVNTPYIIVRHSDHKYPHCHIVYSRVDNNGRIISDSNDRKRSYKICRAITRKYGLTWGKDKRNVNRKRLKGKDKVKYAIYDAARAALADCRDWEEFVKEMAKRGVMVRFKTDSNGKVTGLTFTKDNVSFGGCKVDKSLTYPKLNRLFLSLQCAAFDSHLSDDSRAVIIAEPSRKPIVEPLLSGSQSVADEFVETVSEGLSEAMPSTGGIEVGNVGEVITGVIDAIGGNAPLSVGGGGGSAKDDDDDERKRCQKPQQTVTVTRRGRR